MTNISNNSTIDLNDSFSIHFGNESVAYKHLMNNEWSYEW
jgi:hypothetical protein